MTGRKILHLTTFLQGGAGKVVVDLAKKSKAIGMSVTVGFTNESVKGYYNYPSHLETLEEVSIQQFKLPSTFDRSPSTILESAKFLLQSLRGNFPDLIHCHAANPSRIALELRKLANFEIPIIQTMHGWGICKTPEQEKEDIETLNEINHLTTVSKSSVNLLRKKGLKNKQCSVIYNGIECFKLPRASIDKDLLEIHRLKNDGLFVIGIVGTIDKRKNQHLVLEMIKTLPREFNIKFIFIGEGEIEKMTNFVNSHYICDRVNFLGYKNNGRELIASLDLLLCPSKSEGFPVTITEAFSTKTLVLASNIPEHKEAIIEGATGFSFKAEDISDLKDKIINIYHMEDSEKITSTAYKFYEDNFSLDKSFAKYDRIYKELTNK